MIRTPRSRKVPQQRTLAEFTTSAPVKGLNDIQPLGAADPAYAIILDNWIAKPEGPTSREGSKTHSTGFDDIEAAGTTFLTYNGRAVGDNKMFLVAGGGVYDVTSTGALGAADVSGLSTTNVYWDYTQQTYTAAAHNYLVAVNGVDAPRIYNGTWTACTQTGSPSAPGQFNTVDNNGTAVDITKFNGVITHQQRLWFVPNTSTVTYYTNIGQVGGNLYAFDFGPFFVRGGALHKLATWTMDGGGSSGVQAILVAFSTKGDVVLFQGTNPSTASTWSYIGTYQLGAPVGKRCTINFQGELLYLSQDGLYPLSNYLKSTRADATSALTYPITNTITRLISNYGTLPGWELHAYPDKNLLIINVPQPGGANNHQYVMNTITKGWSRILGWSAKCMTTFNGEFFFCTATKVMQGFIGGTDFAGTDGTNGLPIVANGLSHFDSFAAQDLDGVTKTILGIKPFFIITGPVSTIGVGINVDFATSTTSISGTTPPAPATGALWDVGQWNVAQWQSVSPIALAYDQWFTTFSPPGVNVAVGVSVSAGSAVTWVKTMWRVAGGYAD